jgi:hypothetical protein
MSGTVPILISLIYVKQVWYRYLFTRLKQDNRRRWKYVGSYSGLKSNWIRSIDKNLKSIGTVLTHMYIKFC